MPTRKGFFPTGSFADEFRVVTAKLKVRGTGKALSILFETQPSKDCVLIGWSTAVSGNSSV